MRGARILNSVSRTLSDVGRRPSHLGVLSRRPFNEPAITRISYPTSPTAPPPLSDLDQLEPLLPVRQQLVDRAGRRHGPIEPSRRFHLRPFEHIAIAKEIDQPEGRHAGLARAEEIARPAQLEIALRDLETVRRLRHRLEPLARLVGQRRLVQQKTIRLVPVAPDPPAQLMELR